MNDHDRVVVIDKLEASLRCLPRIHLSTVLVYVERGTEFGLKVKFTHCQREVFWVRCILYNSANGVTLVVDNRPMCSSLVKPANYGVAACIFKFADSVLTLCKDTAKVEKYEIEVG